LYEITLRPEIQKTLRAEIMQVLNKHNGSWHMMAYLDMVVSGEGIEAGCILIRTFDGKLCP
jgi:hypothetical protein